MPATLDRLPELLGFVVSQGRQAGLPSERLTALELVVEEAAVNVINHAYPDRPGALGLTCWSDRGVFIVEITDDGPPFDPTAAPPPDTNIPLEQRRIGGLGLLLIRKSCDRLSWRRKDGRNILTCRFRLNPTSGRQP